MSTLSFGDLTFELRTSARRRLLEIIVERDGSLAVAAPESFDPELLREFVESKRLWIYTKLAEKEILTPQLRPKELVSGEGFPYLGRSYRLQVVDLMDRRVKLEQGRLKLRRIDLPNGRELLIKWYSRNAKTWLSRRIARWAPRIGVEPRGLEVRDMGFRWGSCGKGEKLYFHWKTIQLPADIIDYLIVHELVHLIEPHHSPSFWQRVERAMPDYRERKQWLAEKGGEYTGI